MTIGMQAMRKLWQKLMNGNREMNSTWLYIYGVSFIAFGLVLYLIYVGSLPFCAFIAPCLDAVGCGLVFCGYLLMRKASMLGLISVLLLAVWLSLMLLKLLLGNC
jgi:hypothetical protein